jgi:hypothetical protein
MNWFSAEALSLLWDLPAYERPDALIPGVGLDVLGAEKAFAGKLGLTYPLPVSR